MFDWHDMSGLNFGSAATIYNSQPCKRTAPIVCVENMLTKSPVSEFSVRKLSHDIALYEELTFFFKAICRDTWWNNFGCSTIPIREFRFLTETRVNDLGEFLPRDDANCALGCASIYFAIWRHQFGLKTAV